MRWKPVPLIASAYSDACRPWSVQDLCGWLPVNAEQQGTRSNVIARTVPGLQEFAAFPDGLRDRGGYVAEDKLFVVKDTTLCQVLPSGAMVIRGVIPGRGRCSFSHNGVSQLKIVTGDAGYIYDWSAETLTQITDEGYPGEFITDYIGHLFVGVEKLRRYWLNSDLDDGLSYNALEVYQGESKPDRIVSLIVANGEVVLFSERSIEHFAYTGVTNALFENKNISQDRGCGAAHSVCLVDNAVFFIGDDKSGYLMRGYEAQRITTHAIEQAWAECDVSKAFAFLWEDKGHKVVYVTFPDGKTWGYDVATQKWHRRASDLAGEGRWRLQWCKKWRGEWYGGEYNSGRIFKLVWGYVLEGADRLPRICTTGVLHSDQNRVRLHAAEIVVDAAGEATTATAVIPFAFSADPAITNALPDGAVGDVVSFRYVTVGGVSPISFAVTSGTLPAGITLDPATGELSGTFTTANHTNAWTITATDALGHTAVKVEAQYVLDMLGTPPNSKASTAYSYTLTGSQGTAPYTFAVTTGSLPPGLSLASGGAITGTTGASLATYPFSVTMTDAAGVDTVKSYSVQIISTSAAVIAPKLIDWFSFDNTLLGQISGSSWSQSYLGPHTYSTGIRGQQLLVTQEYIGPVAFSLYNKDWSLCFWVDTSDHSIDNTTTFGTGYSTGIGTNPYAGVAVRTPAGAGITAQALLYDGSAFHTSSYISVVPSAAGRIMFSLVYDNTAKTLSVYANGDPTPFATASMGTILDVNGTVSLCARWGAGANSSPFDSQHKSMDEWGVFSAYKLTASDIAYLYNSGMGKTYPEVIADSIL